MPLGGGGAAVLGVKIVYDSAEAGKGLDDAAGGVDKFSAKMGKLAAPAGIALAGIAAFGKSALTAASDAEQAMGGVDSVFGGSAQQIKDWSDQAATSVGLSKKDYGQFATVIGAGFKTAGVPMDQIAGKTDDMIKLGADLAATYGGTTADAVDALSASMRGEYDSTEKYAVGLSAASVAAKMAADGTDKLTGTAFTAAKASATLALAQKNAGGAMGQFGRESDGASGSAAIAAASFENTKAKLGEVLLPVAAKAATIFGELAGFIGDNSAAFQILLGVLGAVAVAVLAASAASKVMAAGQTIASAATKVWAAGQWLLNAAMSANPIGIVIIAIVAIVAAIVVLWVKCEAFRNFFIGVWKAIQAAAAVAWAAIQTAFNVVVAALKVAFAAILVAATAVWNAIKIAVAALGVAVTAVWNAIKVAAAAVWAAIGAVINVYATAIKLAIKGVQIAAAAVWTAIKAAADAVWAAIKVAADACGKAIGAAFKAAETAVKAVWTAIVAAAEWAWALIMAPVNAGIGAIVAAWETITGAVDAVFRAVIRVVEGAMSPIKAAIAGLKSVWDSTFGIIQKGIETVGGWITGLFNRIKSPPAVPTPAVGAPRGVVGGYAVAAGLSPAAMSARTAGPVAGSGGAAAGVNITVNGAVDPDGTARQIRALLTGRDRRTGGVRIGGAAVAAL